MTRRVLEKLCTEKFCVDLAPRREGCAAPKISTQDKKDPRPQAFDAKIASIANPYPLRSLAEPKIRKLWKFHFRCSKTEHFLRVLFSFCFPPPHRPLPSWIPPLPPPFPRGNTIFRGWGAARVLEGVTPQKKEGISLKNGAQKLVRKCPFWRSGPIKWPFRAI